jgi:hypothetical protein
LGRRQEGLVLARGRHWGLLARGNASGVGNLNVDIVGAADPLTEVVTVMLINIIVGVFVVCVGQW